jgi:hypothetical protein
MEMAWLLDYYMYTGWEDGPDKSGKDGGSGKSWIEEESDKFGNGGGGSVTGGHVNHLCQWLRGVIWICWKWSSLYSACQTHSGVYGGVAGLGSGVLGVVDLKQFT